MIELDAEDYFDLKNRGRIWFVTMPDPRLNLGDFVAIKYANRKIIGMIDGIESHTSIQGADPGHMVGFILKVQDVEYAT